MQVHAYEVSLPGDTGELFKDYDDNMFIITGNRDLESCGNVELVHDAQEFFFDVMDYMVMYEDSTSNEFCKWVNRELSEFKGGKYKGERARHQTDEIYNTYYGTEKSCVGSIDTADFLQLLTGLWWNSYEIHGAVQREWNVVYYRADEIKFSEIEYIQKAYFGMYKRFRVDKNAVLDIPFPTYINIFSDSLPTMKREFLRKLHLNAAEDDVILYRKEEKVIEYYTEML